MLSPAELQKEYIVTFEDRPGYLYAHIKGEKKDLSVARMYWTQIAEKALSANHERVMVVEDFAETISIAEVHQLVSELSELPIHDIRVAFVDPHVQHKSLNEFGILVGENRGLTLQSFDTPDQAEDWLKKN